MQEPREVQETVTRFACPHCDRLHPLKQKALDCCTCEKCGKRKATVKGDRWSSRENYCELCWNAKNRKRIRDRITRLEEDIRRSEQKVRDLGVEIKRAKMELLMYGGKAS